MVALIGLLCAGSLWAHGQGRGDGSPKDTLHRGQAYPPVMGPQRRGDGPSSEAPRGSRGNPAPAEMVTIDGTLQLVEGHIAVVTEGKTYFVNGLQRLIGFIDGLKENAELRLEGAATAVPFNANARFLWVTKLTFNGKTYDLPNNAGGAKYWGIW